MKKIKFYVAASFVALAMMMSSCMSDGKNEINEYGCGVIDFHGNNYAGQRVLYYNDYYFPVAVNSSSFEPEYVIAQVLVDLDNEYNADVATKGYYSAGSVQIYDTIDALNISYSSENEEDMEPIYNEGVVSAESLISWVNSTLFIGLGVKAPKDSDIRNRLYFNPNQIPEEVTHNSEKIRVYDFYIRTIVDASSSTTEASEELYYAVPFGKSSDYNRVLEKEKESSNTSFGIRLKYAKSIDEETGEIEWAGMRVNSEYDYLAVYVGNN
ncbi:MAG: hypothetical protein LUG98_15680 [Tannerellaceae bacterium]|nr:hypothetical protein [Tannerellaceae bacterium]